MERLIKLLFTSEETEERLGDIHQVHSEMRSKSSIKASIWYFFQILQLVVMGLKQSLRHSLSSLKNNCRFAFRNLMKQKSSSLVNITGLSLSLTCCMCIFLYINYEVSYDRFNERGDRIYRVISHIKAANLDFNEPVISAPVKDEILSKIPEVENCVRFIKRGEWQLTHNNINFTANSTAYTDQSFFQIFSVHILKGANRLDRADSVMLSSSLAEKIFGKEDPLGKTIKVNNDKTYTVSGVYKDIPANSHFNFDLLLSMKDFPEKLRKSWTHLNYFTFLMLKEGVTPEVVINYFPDIMEQQFIPRFAKVIGASAESVSASLSLQPLFDIYLHSDFSIAAEDVGNINYVNIFGLTGLLILIIACINFMNLTTATIDYNTRNACIRKIAGSGRSEILFLSLTETFLIVAISVLTSITTLRFALPLLNDLAGKDLSINSDEFIPLTFFIITVMLVTAFISGIYPALIVSSANPSSILRSTSSRKRSSLRKILVVLQFSSSIILISSTIIINTQLDFIRNRKTGYTKEQVLILENSSLLKEKIKSFNNKLGSMPGVLSTSVSSFLPVGGDRSSAILKPEGLKKMVAQVWEVDHNYNRTFQIQIKKGRDFSESHPTDKSGMIINSTAAKMLGWKNPIGKTISTNTLSKKISCRIIGVIEDFNYESMRQKIGPLVMCLSESRGNISLRIATDKVEALISDIKKTWQEFLPDSKFSFYFLDDEFNKLYNNEARLGRIFGIFASIAIFIGCLGLFGMSSFIATNKSKEIGVRKVLGASVTGIVTMLSKEFVSLIVISNIIAAPVAYFTMKQWLKDFAYRSDIDLLIFVISGLSALLIAIATVSFHTIKAANTNPVKTLKQE